MTTSIYEIGQKLQVLVYGQIFDGVIVAFGEHKGREVISLDCHRFVYLNQIIGIYNTTTK